MPRRASSPRPRRPDYLRPPSPRPPGFDPFRPVPGISLTIPPRPRPSRSRAGIHKPDHGITASGKWCKEAWITAWASRHHRLPENGIKVQGPPNRLQSRVAESEANSHARRFS